MTQQLGLLKLAHPPLETMSSRLADALQCSGFCWSGAGLDLGSCDMCSVDETSYFKLM